MKKWYWVIGICLIIFISVLIVVYHSIFGISKEAIESALNGFIVNLIIVGFTALFLDLLIRTRIEKANRKKELSEYKDVMVSVHISLAIDIETFIHVLITKEGFITDLKGIRKNDENIEMKDLKIHISKYVDSKFINKEIKLLSTAEPPNYFSYNEVQKTYTSYLRDQKPYILDRISRYINTHSKIMPVDVLTKLVRINSIIENNSIFLVSKSKNENDNIDKQILNETNQKYFRKILNELIDSTVKFKLSIYKDTK